MEYFINSKNICFLEFMTNSSLTEKHEEVNVRESVLELQKNKRFKIKKSDLFQFFLNLHGNQLQFIQLY